MSGEVLVRSGEVFRQTVMINSLSSCSLRIEKYCRINFAVATIHQNYESTYSKYNFHCASNSYV
jgi:hypothetical protein